MQKKKTQFDEIKAETKLANWQPKTPLQRAPKLVSNKPRGLASTLTASMSKEPRLCHGTHMFDII